MSNQLPVLIIGAGPTGLMMACELERRNIPFRIIDKKSTRTEASNATWIQTRTLEILDAMGIADCFLKAGHRCDSINLYSHGKQLANIPFNAIDSIYPFILMLSQSDTERLLSERLQSANIQIERPVELIDISQSDKGIVSSVRFSNGNSETIASDWVIACDGANSTVRQKCEIAFSGKDMQEQFMVADAQLSSFLPNNEIHVFFDKGTVFPDKGTLFAAFPWGVNKYRLNANLYHEHPRKSFTEIEVREVVAERAYGNYIVDNVSWISPFWIHSKTVECMRKNAIFLVGDAAHIHSPAGGQGMNTGMQDAYNLAWKLALVIKQKANLSLLDSYQIERYPVVKKVVEETEYFTNMVLYDKSFSSQLKKFCQKLAKNTKLSEKIVSELTQLNIHYKNSPVIDYQEKMNSSSLRQGERAPTVLKENTLHSILLFTGKNPIKNKLAKLIELQKKLNAEYLEIAKTCIITTQIVNDVDNIMLDMDGVIHQHFKITIPAVYIIRPDNYIAYCSSKLDFDTMRQFLGRYLV